MLTPKQQSGACHLVMTPGFEPVKKSSILLPSAKQIGNEMSKPISPKEAVKLGPKIPDAVIDAVNTLLAEKIGGRDNFGEIVLYKSDIAREANMDEDEILENNWFDFEPLYRQNGWSCWYDKPAYNENYKGHFRFKKKD